MYQNCPKLTGEFVYKRSSTIAKQSKGMSWSEKRKIVKQCEKEKNKEIISIEMDDSGSVFHDSTHRYIDSIVYIDDDGIKTKIDCSNRILSPAEIEESTDKKYHITIIEDKDIIVYIPVITEYTSK